MRLNDLTCLGWEDFALIDSGDGRKLEQLGGYVVDRPSVQAIWCKRVSDDQWETASSRCERLREGGGRWHHQGNPKGLICRWRGAIDHELQFALRLTEFGHCGLFFEQEPIWRLTQERLASITKRRPRCVNLFGYTGAASLAAAATGAEVFHVDSAKGVLDWGKANAVQSQVDGIRWIHDDVRSFLALSKKRGWTYDVVLADPPSFGHGAKKQDTWSFEDHVADLVDDCAAITADDGLLVVSSHTPGVQREAIVNLMREHGALTAGELGIQHRNDARILPAGLYVAADRS